MGDEDTERRIAAPPRLHLPTIGRVVLHCDHALTGLAYTPATIVRVERDGTVRLRDLGLGIIVPKAAYSKQPVPGTWCWPADALPDRMDGQPFNVAASGSLRADHSPEEGARPT
jgi:hypothetical protein